MALAEVIEFEAAGVGVEAPPDKCPDCWGTGGILDEDGSLTGIVGQPVACGCASPPGFCHVVAHPAGCRCADVEVEPEHVVPPVLVEAPSWWGLV